MKEKRNLSGIYFRCQEENGKWGNRAFEDLDEEKQREILDSRKDTEWIKGLAIQLANTLNEIGEHFDIVKG